MTVYKINGHGIYKKSEADFKTWPFYFFTLQYLSQIPKFLPSLSHLSPKSTLKQNILLAKIDCCHFITTLGLMCHLSSHQGESYRWCTNAFSGRCLGQPHLSVWFICNQIDTLSAPPLKALYFPHTLLERNLRNFIYESDHSLSLSLSMCIIFVLLL